MLKSFVISWRSIIVLTILTGLVYPLAITLVLQFVFSDAASGSLVFYQDKVVGSSLVAQKFSSPRYFSARPSASDYAAIPSGASNLGPTSSTLKDAIAQRQKDLGEGVPGDLLTASASGLDPHISPDAARYQLAKVAQARGLDDSQKSQLEKLIGDQTEEGLFGFIGMPRVNVLLLNIAVDKKFP